jgi:ubiquinone biosynthesis monooxygenase Coq7
MRSLHSLIKATITKSMRKKSFLDHAISSFDNALQTITGVNTQQSLRQSPAADQSETILNAEEKKHAASLMRINHVGEVCAQALYQGQALTARSNELQKQLQKAAEEETDHLHWCEQRIQELNSHTSYLNPFWYMGSFTIGAIAGLSGDKFNLGFLAETEHQVEQHLSDQLQKLPAHDHKSRLIIEKMREDEIQHAAIAEKAGGVKLPFPVSLLMKGMAGVMKRLAYWI